MSIHLVIVRVINVTGVRLSPSSDGIIDARRDKLINGVRLGSGNKNIYPISTTCLVRVPGLLVAPGGGLEVVGDDGAPGDQVEQEAHPQGRHQVGGHRGQPRLQALTGGQRQAGLDVTEREEKIN